MKRNRPVYLVMYGLAVVVSMLFGADQSQAAVPDKAVGMPVVQSGLPDLIVESIEVDPPKPGQGSIGNITITVKNVGDAPAVNFDLYLYVEPVDLPPNMSTADTIRTTYRLDPLQPGGIWRYTRTNHQFTQSNPPIFAWVDRNNQVAESDETNNLFPPPPDKFEEDDTCNTAKPIYVDAPPQEHNLFRQDNQPDHDWVKFDATAGVIYYVTATDIGTDANVTMDALVDCERFGLSGGKIITITAEFNTTYYISIDPVDDQYGPYNTYQVELTSDERCNNFEPNDQCTLAQPLYADGQAASSFLCRPNDTDWFTFEVAAGVQYTVTASNVGSDADIGMRVLDSCGGAIVGDSLNATYTSPRDGIAVLQVENQNTQAEGLDTEYSITIDAGGQCEPDPYESVAADDSDMANARPITAGGEPQQHNICPAGDVDWIRFNAAADTDYTIETFALSDDADTHVCLYAADGKQISCDDDSGAGLGSRLHLKNAEAGEYFIRVSDVDPRVAGATTRYHVQVLPELCTQDSYEPDDLRTLATPWSADADAQAHTICGREDQDWISFNAAAQTPYVIETDSLGVEADTVIALYDANGAYLAGNDDYSNGIASQLNYTVTEAGVYFVQVRLYNTTLYGEGTQYELKIHPGIANPQDAPPQAAPDEPPGTPSLQGAKTLILVNESRLTALYGAVDTQQLMAQLVLLADHDAVKGEIVKVDQLAGMQNLYSDWENGWAPGKANEIADRIRSYIRRYRSHFAGMEYLIIVGDDRIIPFYRLPDRTDESPESAYSAVNTVHPTGVALRTNYFLTDDFYAAPENLERNHLLFYVPDLAVGRLVETPSDISAFINRFLKNATPQVEHVLVTGWTFVTDLAQDNCRYWREKLEDTNNSRVNCNLIGDTWLQQDFRTARLNTAPTYLVQSINGHAIHYGDQAPDLALLTTAQLITATVDFQGGLIYSTGCHGGLNVPPENSDESGKFIALDLPEVLLQRGANYIGNTGNGYGEKSVSLSERLSVLLTEELGENTSYASALTTAKQRYFGEMVGEPSSFDQKVLHEWTFYGIPMFAPTFGAPLTLGDEDPFPGVAFELTPLDLGPDLSTQVAHVDLRNGDIITVETDAGVYFSLSGKVWGSAGEPVQPLYFKELGSQYTSVRSVILRDASFSTRADVDPQVLTPINENIVDQTELPLDETAGWLPQTPLRVNSSATNATFAMQASQYNASTGQFRSFNTVTAELVYSTSADRTPPSISVVDGLYDTNTNEVTVKVGAMDESGIYAVTLVYIDNETDEEGAWHSFDLAYDPAGIKWRGVFPGNRDARFFVQVIDNNGNKTDATNKGRWYTPAPVASSSVIISMHQVFLPDVKH